MIAGTHGNESSGVLALYTLVHALQSGTLKIQHGSLRIIPCVNVWGTSRNVRYAYDKLGLLPKSDINRNYTAAGGTDPISKQVIQLTQSADLILDFHDGWGFHTCQPQSVGSTLTPTNTDLAITLAQQAVKKINESIFVNCKKFSCLLNESCTIPTTLACHMQTNRRNYILIETTCQNGIQPSLTCMSQIFTIVSVVLMGLQMCRSSDPHAHPEYAFVFDSLRNQANLLFYSEHP